MVVAYGKFNCTCKSSPDQTTDIAYHLILISNLIIIINNLILINNLLLTDPKGFESWEEKKHQS